MTCGILHGAMADKLVLCHDAGREVVHGYESFPLPDLSTYIDLYESLAAPVADSEIVAGALNTSDLEGDEARKAVDEYADAIDVPATDVVRFDSETVLDALL